MAKFHNCVAVQFDSTATYKLGEHVMYNDMLYKCIVNDYSAGEFSLDNFEQTYLADAVNVGNIIDENIAPVYDSTLTYVMGEYVLYNTELYVCIEPVTAAEPFDSEKWERSYVSNVVEGNPVETGHLEYIADEYDENTTYEIGDTVIYDGCMYECVEGTSGEFDETMWKRTYISENVLRDANTLNNNLMKKIWENESPTENFVKTTLDLSSYNIPNGIIIYCKGFKTATAEGYFNHIFIRNDGIIKNLYDYHAIGELHWRGFTLSSDNQLSITQGYKTTSLNDSTSTASKSDGSVIPLEIYTV